MDNPEEQKLGIEGVWGRERGSPLPPIRGWRMTGSAVKRLNVLRLGRRLPVAPLEQPIRAVAGRRGSPRGRRGWHTLKNSLLLGFILNAREHLHVQRLWEKIVLGRPWSFLGRSWAILGCLGALLGRLRAVLGRRWAALGAVLVVLGALLGTLGPVLVRLGLVLGHLRPLLGRSWAALRLKTCGALPVLARKGSRLAELS